jgi:hypothetical protein
MNTKSLIAEIDDQIVKLQHTKNVLLALDSPPAKGKRGRPKGPVTNKAAPKRRKLSAEARAKIAEAQKNRWDAVKK